MLHSTLREAAMIAKRPLIGAHRGYCKIHVENTLEAFRESINLGADFIELDVQLSQDGIPVVIHDETVDRTTSGSGLVREFSYEQLKKWGTIPSLDEVFAEFKQVVFFNIELKPSHNNDKMLDVILELIHSHNVQDTVIISSFNHELLYRLRKLNSHVLTGVLFETPLPQAAAYAKSIGANALHPYYPLLKRKLAAEYLDANLMVLPWTVDKDCYINYFTTLGVTGIITNRTDRAVLQLKNRQ